MRALVGLVPVIVFALSSCGQTGASPGAGAPDDSGVVTASNGVAATCHPTCSTAADCGTPGDPLYDPSHFACQAGICQWLGCRSPSECSAEAHGGNFLCKAASGAAPTCVPACQRPADCVPPGNTSALDDVNHFACTAGACVWTGCASTAECAAATHTSKVSCERPAGATAPTCVPTCATANDCVMQSGGALGDASHYACQAHRCQWLGCKSTTECTKALASSRYVCE
jgi:hypothetical protein